MAPTAREIVRAQAKEATRRALLQAGLEEAIERGGVGTPSIDAICARAGYTRGAFYVHFEDRTEFVVALMDWVMTDIVGVLFGSAGRESGFTEIVDRFTTVLSESEWPDLSNVRAGYLGVMEAVQRSRTVRERHAEFMKGALRRLEEAAGEAQRRRTLRQDVGAHDIADLTMLVAVGAIMWDRIGIPLDVRSLGRSFSKLLAASSSGGGTTRPRANKTPSRAPRAKRR